MKIKRIRDIKFKCLPVVAAAGAKVGADVVAAGTPKVGNVGKVGFAAAPNDKALVVVAGCCVF